MGAQGVPRGTKILGRARRRSSRVAVREIREPSRSLRLQVHVLEASSERQIEIAFETLKQKPVGALLLANDTFLSGRRELFIALAARHAVAVMYPGRDSVTAGGLMSYDATMPDIDNPLRDALLARLIEQHGRAGPP
jgi:putative ABC transport system substrate-binding protein